MIDQYGADAFRCYEMFMGPLEQMKPWSMRGVEGVSRFLARVWRLLMTENQAGEWELSAKLKDVDPDKAQQKITHATIKKVTEDIEIAFLQHRDLADDDFRKRIYQRRSDSVVGDANIPGSAQSICAAPHLRAMGKTECKISAMRVATSLNSAGQPMTSCCSSRTKSKSSFK